MKKIMRVAAVGAGKIVNEFLEIIENMEEIACEAIYVRETSLGKGEALAEKFHIKRVYTNYQEMLDNKDVDFVYVGISNDVHFSFTKQALQSDKHVILEKPFTCTFAETKELVELAQERKLFLFEAIKNIYAPLLVKMQEAMTQIGEIKLVQGDFSRVSSRYLEYQKGDIHPAFDPKAYGGSLYDMNVYNLHLIIYLFGEPSESKYLANKGFNGVDTSGIAYLRYPNLIATAAAAKDVDGENHFIIQGDKGYVKSEGEPSVLPTLKTVIDGEVKHYQDEDYKNSMKYEFKHFWKMWADNDYQACVGKMEHTVRVMKVLDKLWRDI